MSWLIRVGRVGFAYAGDDRLDGLSGVNDFNGFDDFDGFARGVNADVTTYSNCFVTSNSGHTFCAMSFIPQGNPNAGKITLGAKYQAGEFPSQAQRVWKDVLSRLVGV